MVTDACGSKSMEAREQMLATLKETGEVFFASSAALLSVMGSHMLR
jgi:hypothetical protein